MAFSLDDEVFERMTIGLLQPALITMLVTATEDDYRVITPPFAEPLQQQLGTQAEHLSNIMDDNEAVNLVTNTMENAESDRCEKNSKNDDDIPNLDNKPPLNMEDYDVLNLAAIMENAQDLKAFQELEKYMYGDFSSESNVGILEDNYESDVDSDDNIRGS